MYLVEYSCTTSFSFSFLVREENLKYTGNNLSEQSREPTNWPHTQGLGQNLTQATLVEGECSDQYLNPAHVYLQANQTVIRSGNPMHIQISLIIKFSYFVLQIFGVKEFNKTIIPWARVGYEMVNSQRGA